MQRGSRTKIDQKVWSLHVASQAFRTDPEALFDWLRRHRYAYRRTGLGRGRKLAYMRWVDDGFFSNEPEIMITRAGMRMLAQRYS